MVGELFLGTFLRLLLPSIKKFALKLFYVTRLDTSSIPLPSAEVVSKGDSKLKEWVLFFKFVEKVCRSGFELMKVCE